MILPNEQTFYKADDAGSWRYAWVGYNGSQAEAATNAAGQSRMRKRMDEYGSICKELAQTHNVVLVDLQAMFDKYFQHRHACFIAWDRIHPNQIGATLIAREFLRHCAFDYAH